MPTPSLPLPTCEHLDVFEQCVRILKAAPDLKRTIKTWFVWDGSPTDAAEWATGMCPGMRLTPSVVDDGWFTPDTLRGRLIVDVEIALTGTAIRNHALVWRAVKRAFYPTVDADRVTIATRLRTAGAYPALVLFQPGFSYSPEDGGAIVVAAGRFSIQVIETLNP
jgi:hypothetical protein